MAYDESLAVKAKKLFQPGGLTQVIPFLKSKLVPLERRCYETFGSDKKSKPYPGHEQLFERVKGRDGFFVEVGGNDGIGHDPTYYLEKFRNWRGLIIEPLPISALCQRNRPDSVVVKAAMVSTNYPQDNIDTIDCNKMSVIKNGVPDFEDWVKKGED